MRDEESKGGEETEEEDVDEQVAVVGVATVGLPLVGEQTDGHRVLQKISPCRLNLRNSNARIHITCLGSVNSIMPHCI